MSADSSAHQRAIAMFSPGWPPGRVANGIVTYVGLMQEAFERQHRQAYVISSNVAPNASSQPAVSLDSLTQSRAQRIIETAVARLPQIEPTGLSFALQVAAGVQQLRKKHPIALLELEETFGAARYVQSMVDIPVVVRLHGPWFLNGTALGEPHDEGYHRRDAAERMCIRDAAGVTAPSRDVLEAVRRSHKVELADAVVIPNPGPQISPQEQWTPGTTDNTTVLFVGRFDRHKGGDTVIDAFAIIGEACVDASLVFVGPDRGVTDDKGQTLSLSEYMVQRLPPHLRARVDVRGPLSSSDIEPLRRQARVTVVASRYEIFGLALVEALAFGSPTVASNTGGIPEVLQEGITGDLFTPGDSADLARKVISLYSDSDRAAAYSKAAALDMANRYNPDRIAEETWAYYESVWARFRPQKRQIALQTLAGLLRLA
jgi:glycosyltransferase involved in cell wall biosynthesis